MQLEGVEEGDLYEGRVQALIKRRLPPSPAEEMHSAGEKPRLPGTPGYHKGQNQVIQPSPVKSPDLLCSCLTFL